MLEGWTWSLRLSCLTRHTVIGRVMSLFGSVRFWRIKTEEKNGIKINEINMCWRADWCLSMWQICFIKKVILMRVAIFYKRWACHYAANLNLTCGPAVSFLISSITLIVVPVGSITQMRSSSFNRGQGRDKSHTGPLYPRPPFKKRARNVADGSFESVTGFDLSRGFLK